MSSSSGSNAGSPTSSTGALPHQPHNSRGPMLGRGLACARCRKRKQRCDGTQPACSNCTGASKEGECRYVTIAKPRRQPHITAREALAEKYARLQNQYALLLSATSPSNSSGPSSTCSSRCSRSSSSPPELSPTSSFACTTFESANHDPLVNAVLMDDMPAQNRDKIIRIFFTGSQRLGCPILPGRFFARLNDPDERKRPHPALTNAMLLVGLGFTEWTPGYSTARKHDLPPNTPTSADLLSKTRAYLHEALSQVDRMLDYLQASILLSYYFFQQDRLPEGQNISSTNSRMTIMCKLHLIDQAVLQEMLPGQSPPLGKSMWDTSLLGRPADGYELGLRIWTFWQSWYYDAVFSLILGTDLVRDSTVPTTVFPRPSAAYESGLAFTLKNTSFTELYQNDPPQFPSPAGEPEGSSHPLCTYLKGLAIMERTNQLLVRINKSLTLSEPEFSFDALSKLHQSLQCLLAEHLPIHEREMLTNSTLSTEAACKIYCSLAERIVGHVFINTATIQLCRLSRVLANRMGSPGSGKSFLASIRAMEHNAARDGVKALRIFGEEVRKLDNRMRGLKEVVTGASVVAEVQEHPCLLLGFLLTSICMVLVDHIHSLKQTEASILNEEDARIVRHELKSDEDDLALCIRTIECTSGSFPLLKTQALKIEEYRDRSNNNGRPVANCHPPRWEFERRATLIDRL